MAVYELDLDLSSALEAPRRCPRCSTEGLAPSAHDDVITLLCPCCGRAWRYELGALVASTTPAHDDDHSDSDNHSDNDDDSDNDLVGPPTRPGGGR